MSKPLLFSSCLLAAALSVAAVNAQTMDTAAKTAPKHDTADHDADNTKVNVADRNMNSTTPFDQSNDQAAIDVTAGIRRAVMDDKSLSTSAHNIKIVTSGDVVTLRGPVASADEKKRIEALAVKAANGKQVRNEISIAR